MNKNGEISLIKKYSQTLVKSQSHKLDDRSKIVCPSVGAERK